MDLTLFERFAPIIKNLSLQELSGSEDLFKKLTLAEDVAKDLRICYAPFEHINTQAKLVIVGITPGATQMINAIAQAKKQLDIGADSLTAVRSAKTTGAFSGQMRPHLINLMDDIGIPKWLAIPSSSELFGASAHLVHTTSALRYPVFYKGGNYNGTPKMTSTALLREQMSTHLVKEIEALPDAMFLALGEKVSDALNFLADQGLMDRARILCGLSHPSPANIERINCFLGKEPKAGGYSAQVDVLKLRQARTELCRRVAQLSNRLDGVTPQMHQAPSIGRGLRP